MSHYSQDSIWNTGHDQSAVFSLPEDLECLESYQLLDLSDLNLELTPETRKEAFTIPLPHDQDCLASPGVAQDPASPRSQQLPSPASATSNLSFQYPNLSPNYNAPVPTSPTYSQPSPAKRLKLDAVHTPNSPVVERSVASPALSSQHKLQSPVLSIKDRLKTQIKSKRPELKPDYKSCQEEVLSAADLEKRNSRRERNKLAAKKCRDKKKAIQSEAMKEYETLEKENKVLRQQLESQMAEQQKLKKMFQDHMSTCQLQQLQLEVET